MNDLTTDALVLEYDAAASAVIIATRNQVRQSVSENMTRFMGRRFISPKEVAVEDHHISNKATSLLFLNEWPLNPLSGATLVVTIDGDTTPLIKDTDYRLEGERIVRHIDGNNRASVWPIGDVQFVYDAGYDVADIPTALVQAATKQTAREIYDINMRKIGITQREPQTGPVETFDEDGFLPSVSQAMMPYRRFA